MLTSRNSWPGPLNLRVSTVNMDLCWGSPNSWKGPQNHNENGDPGSPFSRGPQNFMTPAVIGCCDLRHWGKRLPISSSRVDDRRPCVCTVWDSRSEELIAWGRVEGIRWLLVVGRLTFPTRCTSSLTLLGCPR